MTTLKLMIDKEKCHHLIDALNALTFDLSKFHQFDLPPSIEVKFKKVDEPLLIEDKTNG